MTNLPPLPQPTPMSQIASRRELEYTASDLETYGTACWNAALEWAIRQCDDLPMNWLLIQDTLEKGKR